MGRTDFIKFWIGKRGPYYYDPTATRPDGTTESAFTFIRSPSGTTERIESLTSVGPGADPTAIHDNLTGEIAAVAEKATPVDGDWVLIEDSAAGNVKKKAQLVNLPGGAAGDSNVDGGTASTVYTVQDIDGGTAGSF